MDRDQGVRIFTPAEAADVVLSRFEAFRDEVRALASDAGGEENRRIRAALVLAMDRFGVLEDAVLAGFGLPSRKGPDRPDLADEQPAVGPVSSVNRTANSAAWRMDAGRGSHRSAP